MSVWNKQPPIFSRLKLWWYRLWVRKSEYHYSVDFDKEITKTMCKCELQRYTEDMAARRTIALLRKGGKI